MPKYEIYVDTDAGELKCKSGDKEIPCKSIRVSRSKMIDYDKGEMKECCSIYMEDEMENEDGSSTYTATRAQIQDFLGKNIRH